MRKNSIFRMEIIFLTIIFLIIISSSLYAATTGKIFGKVIDKETGEPLIGANILIVGTSLGATSDKNGEYFIINIPPGIFSVRCSYMGYRQVTTEQVRIYVGRTTHLNFELSPSVLEGKSVTVTAERPIVVKDLTASEQVITAENIYKTWARSFDEVISTQTGVFRGHFRGGSKVETSYLLDNVSLNSGLLSDNYQGLNTTSLQEIAVQTGGYNAEFGNAQSGVVTMVSKSSEKGIHGTFLSRMRPAGKYHWGRNIYSHENYDWAGHGLDFWTEQSLNPQSQYFGQDPNELLAKWQTQMTPDPIQGKYTERPEYETEFTIYGAANSKIGFLLSGRYKRGVNIFPQMTPYNPEYNIQGNLEYNFNKNMKLKFSGIYGGYETCSNSLSNYNTLENSQEIAWIPFPQATDPYHWFKINMVGAWHFWPELRKTQNYSLKWRHVLSPKTFYEINFNYLHDNMDKTDRDNLFPWTIRTPDNKWDFDDEKFGMLGIYELEGYIHFNVWFDSKVYSIKGDLTSQVNKNNLIKTGFEAKSYDFVYDHAMAAYEGGSRWNLMNVFNGKPYEGSYYVQDKLEFAGMIINAGVRMDFFNQKRNAPKNMFDPLAYESTTPGNKIPWYPGEPEREKTKTQFAIAPRLGISHPISENTVLHFNYGHFYQRPSWNKMFGFPYISYTEDNEVLRNPYDPNTIAYMDQWQGYLGNPKMGYEKTVQYEIGVDQNIANLLRLDITGYYKDASRQTVFREGTYYDPYYGDLNTWTVLYNAWNQYNVPLMISNCAYADIRGLEVKMDTRFKFPLNFNLSYDLNYTTGGVVGYATLYEFDSGVNSPQGYAGRKKPWNSNSKFKGIANLYFPSGFGPAIAGFKPLSDFNVNLYFEYWNGWQYTYHGPGDESTEPNNMRWFPHYRTNLKIAKGMQIMGIRAEVSMDIRNLFNNKDLNLLFGNDMVYYQEHPDLPLEERLPKHWWSGEPNEWAWYSWTNLPRQIYFQLKVDF